MFGDTLSVDGGVQSHWCCVFASSRSHMIFAFEAADGVSAPNLRPISAVSPILSQRDGTWRHIK